VAVCSGTIGFGLGAFARMRQAECDGKNGALVPSMMVGMPGRPAQDFTITGAPVLPQVLPSAVAALQWAGWPGFDNIKFRKGYVVSFNRATRNPNWVCEHLCAETLTGNSNRKNSDFQEDLSDPPHLRNSLKDFKNSGFDRGHMVAAAAIKFDQSALDETFIMSNISPQVGAGFNRGFWERMERWTRNLVAPKGPFSDVFVISGPIYLPRKEEDGKYYMQHQVLGNPPGIQVPTHFFKVILGLPSRDVQAALLPSNTAVKNDPNTTALLPVGRAPDRPIALGAFVVPNEVIDDSTDLMKFAVPIEVAERFAGLQFFQRLPKENHKFVKPLCSATKCILPGPFQQNNNQKGRIVEVR